MPVLLNLDYRLFKFFNSFAGISKAWDFTFVALAEWVIFALVAGLALFILFKKDDKKRGALALQALASAFVGKVLVVSFIRIFFYRFRPFVAGAVTQLEPHNPLEASFPSGHATIMFAMAFSVLFGDTKWGIFYFIIALISSLARVVVGVHYPMDIFGGMLVALLSSIAVKLAWNSLKAKKNKKALLPQ
ncbi:phosphatase PAP2 family protein [Candidatus Peregrinibacteria bacterium]|nr:phosphatase PAP2 family protein [Candidatus Peregrinibacteria bacterium]